MKFASVRRSLLAVGLMLTTAAQAFPFYGNNFGFAKIQARDLTGDQCTDVVYGANSIKIGTVCGSILNGILTIIFSPLANGCTYNQVHVFVGTSKPTDRNPGGFPYSSPSGGCTISAGGATASCSIDVKPEWRACEITLYIATHAAVTCPSGSETAWGMGPCFGGDRGNCAKYWQLTTHCFCPTVIVFPQEYSTSTSIYTSTSTTEYLTSTTITYETQSVSTYTTSTTVTFDTSTTSEYSVTEYPETVITSVTTSTFPLSSTTETVTCTKPYP